VIIRVIRGKTLFFVRDGSWFACLRLPVADRQAGGKNFKLRIA
jgi:hypothetical protein